MKILTILGWICRNLLSWGFSKQVWHQYPNILIKSINLYYFMFPLIGFSICFSFIVATFQNCITALCSFIQLCHSCSVHWSNHFFPYISSSTLRSQSIGSQTSRWKVILNWCSINLLNLSQQVRSFYFYLFIQTSSFRQKK